MSESDSGGMAGGEEPSPDAEPETDPELKDYGPPAHMPEEADPEDVGEGYAVRPWPKGGTGSI